MFYEIKNVYYKKSGYIGISDIRLVERAVVIRTYDNSKIPINEIFFDNMGEAIAYRDCLEKNNYEYLGVRY